MATENRETNAGLDTDSKQPIEQTTGTGRSEENTSTTTTADGGRKRGRPRTTATTENTGTGTTEKTGISGLAVLNGDNPETVPTPKKAKQKRTRTKKNAKNDVAFNEEQITAILMTVSGVLSVNENGKIFALSEEECKQISKPLSNIIANNDSLKGLSEHSDGIALATACAMIFLPRLFMFIQIKKQQKALKDKGVKLIKQEVKPNDDGKTGTTGSGSKSSNGQSTLPNQNDGKSILSALSPLA